MTEQNPMPASEDVEGHLHIHRGDGDDVEGHKFIRPEDHDVEGHLHFTPGDGDDVEGHRYRSPEAEGDDAKGEGERGFHGV